MNAALTDTLSRPLDLDDAKQLISWLPGDIQEAHDFIEKGNYSVAINLISAITRDIENILALFPQFEAQVAPRVAEATTLTQNIIRLSSK